MRTVLLRSLACLSVCVLAIGTAQAGDIDQFLPEDTHLVVSLDVQQLVAAPLFQHYCQECIDTALCESEGMQELRDCFGLDPLKDIQRITVADCGSGDDGNTVIIVRGQFDADQFDAACAKYVEADHGDVEAMEDNGHHYWVFPDSSARQHGSILFGTPNADTPGKYLAIRWKGAVPSPCGLLGTLFVAVVDEHTLVLSTSADAVLHAFEQASGDAAPAPDDAMYQLIARAHGKPTLWVAALPEDDSEAGAAEESEPFSKVQSLRGSIRVSSGLDVRFMLEADSNADARKLMESAEDLSTRIDGFVKFLSGKEETPLTSLVKSFKTIRSGRRIKVEGHVDAQLLDELLGMMTLEKVPNEESKPAEE